MLTEAIEVAGRGAGAAIATVAGLAVTVTVMITARMATSTVAVDVLAPDLDPLMMTDTTAPRAVLAEMSVMRKGALVVNAIPAREVAHEAVTKARNLTKMSVIGVPFLCSNSRQD